MGVVYKAEEPKKLVRSEVAKSKWVKYADGIGVAGSLCSKEDIEGFGRLYEPYDDDDE
jgi:hypothetical protein